MCARARARACACVCLGVGGRCDVFNVGVDVTVFVGVDLAVNVEVVKGRNMSNVCSFYAFIMNNKIVLYCHVFIKSYLYNYSQDMLSIVYSVL